MDVKQNHRKWLFIGIGIIIVIAVVLILLLSRQPEPPVETPAETTTTIPETTTEPETETTKEETTTVEETTREKRIYVDPVIDFDALKDINPDVAAYIDIPDTRVSYPIMRSSTQEDDYYLETTFEGNHGLPGSIYIQQITSPDFSDYISVIYGHDMADGSFFGTLYYYIEEKFFNDHQTFYIYTPKKQYTYRVVAESVVDDWNISYLYETKKRKSAKKFWKALHTGEAENRFDKTYKYHSGDKYAVLSVCIGGRPNNRRVIVGVLTEEAYVKQK